MRNQIEVARFHHRELELLINDKRLQKLLPNGNSRMVAYGTGGKGHAIARFHPNELGLSGLTEQQERKAKQIAASFNVGFARENDGTVTVSDYGFEVQPSQKRGAMPRNPVFDRETRETRETQYFVSHAHPRVQNVAAALNSVVDFLLG